MLFSCGDDGQYLSENPGHGRLGDTVVFRNSYLEARVRKLMQKDLHFFFGQPLNSGFRESVETYVGPWLSSLRLAVNLSWGLLNRQTRLHVEKLTSHLPNILFGRQISREN